MTYTPSMATPTSAGHAPVTWEQFLEKEDGDHRELIDGELVETEVNPSIHHETAIVEIIVALHRWKATHGGIVLASHYGVRISDTRALEPDVQFFRANNIPARDQNRGLTRGHPDLVVEVISPSRRRFDRVKKPRWYAEIGVPEYWVVDPEACTLERFILRVGHYSLDAAYDADDVFRPGSFEGLEIPIVSLGAGAPDEKPGPSV